MAAILTLLMIKEIAKNNIPLIKGNYSGYSKPSGTDSPDSMTNAIWDYISFQSKILKLIPVLGTTISHTAPTPPILPTIGSYDIKINNKSLLKQKVQDSLFSGLMIATPDPHGKLFQGISEWASSSIFLEYSGIVIGGGSIGSSSGTLGFTKPVFPILGYGMGTAEYGFNVMANLGIFSPTLVPPKTPIALMLFNLDNFTNFIWASFLINYIPPMSSSPTTTVNASGITFPSWFPFIDFPLFPVLDKISKAESGIIQDGAKRILSMICWILENIPGMADLCSLLGLSPCDLGSMLNSDMLSIVEQQIVSQGMPNQYPEGCEGSTPISSPGNPALGSLNVPLDPSADSSSIMTSFFSMMGISNSQLEAATKTNYNNKISNQIDAAKTNNSSTVIGTQTCNDISNVKNSSLLDLNDLKLDLTNSWSKQSKSSIINF